MKGTEVMRRKITRSAISVTAAALALVTAACSSNGSSNGGSSAAGVTAKTIEIGTSTGLSGPESGPCNEVNNAAQAWFKSINAKGGVNGRTIQVTTLDDVGTAPGGVQNARKFIGQGVLAVFGGCGSIAAAAMYSLLNEKGIPYMFPDAAVDELTTPIKKYVFAVTPSYAKQNASLATYAIHKFGPGGTMSVSDELPNYQQMDEAVQQVAQTRSGTWDGAVDVPLGTSSLASAALQIEQKKPKYIVVSMQAPDAARLVSALAAQNALPAHILGGTGLVNSQFTDAGGWMAGSRFMGASPTASATDPANTACVSVLKAAGVPADSQSLFSCGAAQLLTAALKAAGKDVTRDKLVTALESLTGRPSGAFAPVALSPMNHVAEADNFIATIQGKQPVVSTQLLPIK
jgi:ABC-type branched-subunit amino acid transport system substrate-binding protein